LEPIRFPSRNSPAAEPEKVYRSLIDHLDALYSTAYRLVGSSELAEDLVQETARKALEGMAGLQNERNLRAWLFRILLNTLRDCLRRRKLWDETQIETEVGDASSPIVAETTAVDVQRALAELTPIARAVILLIDVEEFTVGEAASLLRIPPGTVCSRLARARSQLRQHLEVYGSRLPRQGGRP
jgi:RNA polymerase sigma-70 factor (ECF subfamily)